MQFLGAEQCWVVLWTPPGKNLIAFHHKHRPQLPRIPPHTVKSDVVHLVMACGTFVLQFPNTITRPMARKTLILPAGSDIMTCSIVITWRSQQQMSSYGMYGAAAHGSSEFLVCLAQAGRWSRTWQSGCSLDTDQTVIHAWYAGVSGTGPPAMPTNLNLDKLDS